MKLSILMLQGEIIEFLYLYKLNKTIMLKRIFNQVLLLPQIIIDFNPTDMGITHAMYSFIFLLFSK